MKAYGLIADAHFHNWQSFSTTLENGVNSRLNALHCEIRRLADELWVRYRGDTIYIAGDLFHVRGSISPSVLNPTLDLFRELIAKGFKIRIIPGNHDLEGKHSSRIGSAVTALEGIGCTVSNAVDAHEEHNVVVVPWVENIKDLKVELERISAMSSAGGRDLIIHAPIDGVLNGIPSHGLSPEYLAGLGFNRVFAGHYHNHKDFGNGVYSIGALSHHTWSDIGSKAGFLIVTDDSVKWHKAHTPEFIDMSSAVDEVEAELLAQGNFVRARIATSDMKSVNELKEWLTGAGASGVVVQVIKDQAKARDGAVASTVSAGASIEASIAAFIAGQGLENSEQLQIECQKVLAEVEIES